MRCEDVQLDLVPYLRGELGLETRATIQRHLAECPACAEEAAAVKEIGHKLRSGLSEWVEQGTCPPDVMLRIESSIRSVRKGSWWQSWPAMVGVAAAAAVVLLVLFGQQAGMPEQLAALPIIGPVASHLLGATATNPTDYRLQSLGLTDTRQGITLAVSELEASSKETRIHYSLQGTDLDTEADLAAFSPELTAVAGAVPLRKVAVVRKKSGDVTLDAVFDPIPAGQPITFSIKQLPVKPAAAGGETQRSGSWQVAFKG